MTVTAVAAADMPPPDHEFWTRLELGVDHAPWCSPMFCGGECRTVIELDGATVVVQLKTGEELPTFSITTPSGVAVLSGKAARQLSGLVSVHTVGIPAAGRRPQ